MPIDYTPTNTDYVQIIGLPKNGEFGDEAVLGLPLTQLGNNIAYLKRLLESLSFEPPISKKTAFNKDFLTASDLSSSIFAGKVPTADDPRFSDTRVPKPHTHPITDITTPVTYRGSYLYVDSNGAITFSTPATGGGGSATIPNNVIRLLKTSTEAGVQSAIESAVTATLLPTGEGNLVQCADTGNILYIKSKIAPSNYELQPIAQRVVPTFASFAAGYFPREEVSLIEYSSGTGLGGGIFRWFPGDASVPDNGGIVSVTGGCWKRVSHLEKKTYRPEDFGCIGDGVVDDYLGFTYLSAAMKGKKGIVLRLEGKATYLLDQYKIISGFEDLGVTANSIHSIQFANIKGLKIIGNSATIQIKGNFARRGMREGVTIPGELYNVVLWSSPDNQLQIEFIHVSNLSGGNFKVLGDVDHMTSDAGTVYNGNYVKFLDVGTASGLAFYETSNSNLRNVTTNKHQADGVYISSLEKDVYGFEAEYVANTTGQVVSKNVTFYNHESLFNIRNGCSAVHAVNINFVGGDLSYSGWDSTGVSGEGIKNSTINYDYSYGPASYGIEIRPKYLATDIAPDSVTEPTKKIHFSGTRLKENKFGPIGLDYAKTASDFVFDDVDIDMSKSIESTAKIYLCGLAVRVMNSILRLGNSGFDFNELQPQSNCVLNNNEIFITNRFCVKDITSNPRLTISDNRIYFPDTPLSSSLPAFDFLDSQFSTYDQGNNYGTSLSGNRFIVPFGYYSSNYGAQPTIIRLAGLGKCQDNTYETYGVYGSVMPTFLVDYTSTVPDNGTYAFNGLYGVIGAPSTKQYYITKPQNECFPGNGSIAVKEYLYTQEFNPFSWPIVQNFDESLVLQSLDDGFTTRV